MYPFQYHRPTSLSEAAGIFASAADGKWLAGGMTLLPAMKLRLAAPSDLIDLAAIDELKGIGIDGDLFTVGAMTLHVSVAESRDARLHIPALSALAEGIGDTQVRNRGTIGGSISNNDPAADYPAAVLGLGARIITSEREIAADDFFSGLFETALAEGEIVKRIAFPVPQCAGYAKFPNPASRYAIVGLMVAKLNAGVRVAVTGAGACVFRVPEMEEALGADFTPGALRGIEVSAERLNDDMHASAEYRAHLVKVMARRAVEAALES